MFSAILPDDHFPVLVRVHHFTVGILLRQTSELDEAVADITSCVGRVVHQLELPLFERTVRVLHGYIVTLAFLVGDGVPVKCGAFKITQCHAEARRLPST